MTYPVVTAHEAAAAGLRPSAFFSIAKLNETLGNVDVANRCRQVGRELAKLVGLDLGGRRRQQRQRPANDNRRAYGKPRSERRAA
jgi:hypothetical protein